MGKTAAEVATDFQRLYALALTNVSAPQAAPPTHFPPGYQPTGATPTYGPPPTQPYSPYQGAPGARPPSPEDWSTDPALATQRYVEYARSTEFAPALAQTASQLAGTNMALVRQSYADDFKRWGPEILQYINTVPVENRSYEVLERVVQVVRSNHIDELAEERARQRLQKLQEEGALLPRSSSGAPAPGAPAGMSIDFNELPAGYREYLQRSRVDQRVLDEFLTGQAGAMYGSTLQERRQNFVKLAGDGDVITEAPLDRDSALRIEDKR